MVFLSYSRANFYFAESLAQALKQRGVDVWFDMHRLRPGTDWAAGIEAGLSEAVSLLLVASPSALDSEWVWEEINAARSTDKPIYVVWAEPVAIPEEIKSTLKLNLISDFDRGIERLVYALQGESLLDDAPPTEHEKPPVIHRIGWKMLLFAALLSMIGVVLAISSAIAGYVTTAIVELVIIGALSLSALVLRLLFLQRKVGYLELRRLLNFTAFLFSPFFALMPLFAVALVIGVLAFGLNSGLITWVAVIGVCGALVAVYLWIRQDLHSIDALRWTPQGKAGVDQRLQLYRYGVTLPQQKAGIRYQIAYGGPDVNYANIIYTYMETAGHHYVGDGPVDKTLLLLSKHTPEAWLQPIKDVIPILVGELPEEKRQHFSHIQYIDFRVPDIAILKALANYLADPTDTTLHTTTTPRNRINRVWQFINLFEQPLADDKTRRQGHFMVMFWGIIGALMFTALIATPLMGGDSSSPEPTRTATELPLVQTFRAEVENLPTLTSTFDYSAHQQTLDASGLGLPPPPGAGFRRTATNSSID
ncbi:MAG: toll/interleukin-1 receptor domain-containing protein [Chloroflexi bacterium]|nr:toll/interleukin-1 receptor domain-containing protein [Chloroflexota bacterium]